MGKILNLDLGTDISDLYGDKTYLSARQYEFSNIKLSEIKPLIENSFQVSEMGFVFPGSANYTVGSVCTHTLNKWAAFKPWNRNHPNTEPHGIRILNQEFDYKKPDGTSGYHLGDFAGYNHYATYPTSYAPDFLRFKQTSAPHETREGMLIITLPEFDIRNIDNITHCYIISSGTDGGGRQMFEYTNPIEITDTFVSNKSLGGSFQYETYSTSYDLIVKIWFGNSVNNEMVKHPVFEHTIDAQAITEPSIGAIFDADIRITIKDNIINYDYTTGAYSFEFKMYDATKFVQITDASLRIRARTETVPFEIQTPDVSFNTSDWVLVNKVLGSTFNKPLTEDVVLELSKV